jgi:CDP-diacylglycerol--serine O-phosphatidyltransferase
MNERRSKRRVELPLTSLLPNLVTVAAICAGLTAIRFSLQHNYVVAVQLIIVAAVFDGLDGRLARMLKSETPLGAELDSLADFLNFGVAPGILLYVWAFAELRDEGWVAVVIYAVCCVLRLARFNVDSKAATEGAEKRFFTGVPAPAGAFLALLPIFASFTWSQEPGSDLVAEIADHLPRERAAVRRRLRRRTCGAAQLSMDFIDCAGFRLFRRDALVLEGCKSVKLR